MRTFATPNENGSLKKEIEVDFWGFHGRRKPDGENPKRNGDRKQQVHWKDWKLYKQVPRKNTIYREALISLEIMKCQRQA